MLTASQLFYLSEVLGIQQVIHPEGWTPAEPTSALEPVASCPWQIQGPTTATVAVLIAHEVESAEQQILKKMISAMKLKDFSILKANSSFDVDSDEGQSLAQICQAPFILVFGAKAWAATQSLLSFERAFGELQTWAGKNWMVTYSLEELLDPSRPQLQQNRKRETWAHLQEVMRLFHGS